MQNNKKPAKAGFFAKKVRINRCLSPVSCVLIEMRYLSDVR